MIHNPGTLKRFNFQNAIISKVCVRVAFVTVWNFRRLIWIVRWNNLQILKLATYTKTEDHPKYLGAKWLFRLERIATYGLTKHKFLLFGKCCQFDDTIEVYFLLVNICGLRSEWAKSHIRFSRGSHSLVYVWSFRTFRFAGWRVDCYVITSLHGTAHASHCLSRPLPKLRTRPPQFSCHRRSKILFTK